VYAYPRALELAKAMMKLEDGGTPTGNSDSEGHGPGKHTNGHSHGGGSMETPREGELEAAHRGSGGSGWASSTRKSVDADVNSAKSSSKASKSALALPAFSLFSRFSSSPAHTCSHIKAAAAARHSCKSIAARSRKKLDWKNWMFLPADIFLVPGVISSRWGWVFLDRTRILSGIQFTRHFIECVVVETKQLVGSNVNMIVTR